MNKLPLLLDGPMSRERLVNLLAGLGALNRATVRNWLDDPTSTRHGTALAIEQLQARYPSLRGHIAAQRCSGDHPTGHEPVVNTDGDVVPQADTEQDT